MNKKVIVDTGELVELIPATYVSEERAYVKNLHPDIKSWMQSLFYFKYNGKEIPVDKIECETADGPKVFYFDLEQMWIKNAEIDAQIEAEEEEQERKSTEK